MVLHAVSRISISVVGVMTKTSIYFIVVVLVFALFVQVDSKGGKDFRELTVHAKAKWTIAVYMNGDNELESSITGGVAYGEDGSVLEPVVKLLGDFHFELAALGSNRDIHVVALVDRVPGFSPRDDNWNETRLYYVNKGDYADNKRGTYWRMPTTSNSSNNSSRSSSEMNMADARRSLVWFIKTAAEFFPSEHLYVSAWDHNWGWHSGWFQNDVTSNGDTMSYGRLYQELKALNDSNVVEEERFIDVIGYDACVASQIEVMDTWRDSAAYFAGSQDYVGWGGVNYATVIAAIRANPLISPRNLSVVIATSMLSDKEDHCASAFHLSAEEEVVVGNVGVSAFVQLVEAVDELSLALIRHLLSEAKSSISDTSLHALLVQTRDATAQVPHYPSDTFHRDLFSLASNLLRFLSPLNATYNDITDAATSILKRLGEARVYNKVTGKPCQGGHGVSIYWTRAGVGPTSDYLTTSFAQRTHWAQFLSMF